MEDGLEKEQGLLPLDDALEKEESFLDLGCIGSMRCRKECGLPLSQPWTFGSSVKPNFINSTTHCLTYYSRKTRRKQWPNLNLYYSLYASSHILEVSLAHVNNVKSP